MKFNYIGVAVAAVIAFGASGVHAAQIGSGGFSGGESVEDFSGLGAAPAPGPFTLGQLTFSEASSGTGGPGWRLLNLGTPNMLTDNAGISSITIDFASSFQRIGLDVGIGPAVYDVAFFDVGLASVGAVQVDLSGGNDLAVGFAGFEHLPGISRVVITETSGENSLVGGIDNIRFENADGVVPLPAALPLMAAGLGAFGFMGWRRRRAAWRQRARK